MAIDITGKVGWWGAAPVVAGSTLNNNIYSVYNAENNTNDSFGSRNGTAMGGLTYTTGKIGQAFNFNGSTSYVQLGDVMDVGLDSWSYSMWFNVSTTNNSMLFSKVRNASSAGRVWAGTNLNKIYFAFETTGGVIAIETTSNISINNWYHVTFILDRSDKLKIFLDGALANVNVFIGTNNLIPYSSTNFNTNHPFRIGTYTDADNTTPIALFNGKIDAFSVWNKVLTASEITELYNSGNGKQYPF